jgi:hypothetical protein
MVNGLIMKTSVLCSLSACVICALVVGVLVTRERAARATNVAHVAYAEGASSLQPSRREDALLEDGRLAALERRMEAMERGSLPHNAVASTDARLPASTVRLSYDEQKKQTGDRIKALVNRFETEGRDPRWASGAARSLELDTLSLSKKLGFAVKRVECKTSVCVSEMEWPNYEAARHGFSALLANNYDLNCARTLSMPRPSDVSVPYSAQLLMDCESLRTEVR